MAGKDASVKADLVSFGDANDSVFCLDSRAGRKEWCLSMGRTWEDTGKLDLRKHFTFLGPG